MAARVVMVDAGVGNLRSVHKALQAVGADVLRTNQPSDVNNASVIILPGVGAFGGFMRGLAQLDLIGPIQKASQKGVPVLGICVGMQALFELGMEMGKHDGLGVLNGMVQPFAENLSIKIQHTGWNQFIPVRENRLFDGLPGNSYVYFNHSYYCCPSERENVLAETEYGINYASVVNKDNLFGVQFHPEKSQRTGLKLLSNFLQNCCELRKM